MAVFPVLPVFPFGAVRARRACGPKSATICLCLWTTVDESSWESHQKKRRRPAFIIPGLVLLCLVLTAKKCGVSLSYVPFPRSLLPFGVVKEGEQLGMDLVFQGRAHAVWPDGHDRELG